MKKLLPFLLIILLCSPSIFAQSILHKSKRYNVPETKFGINTLIQNTKIFLNFTDTLAYPGFKATDYNIFGLFNNPQYCVSVGQYYDCPQSISVKGVVFYGFAYMTSSVTVTVELFLQQDSLPTGAALATQTMTVDSFQTHAHRVLMFNTPPTVTQPYIITVTYAASTPAFVIVTNQPTANDGKSEWLAVIKQTTGLWKKSKLYSGGSKNFDFMIMPIVQYDVADPSFTMNPYCISNNGDIVNVTLNCPNVYKNRMYDYYAATDSAKFQFAWNFGDTEDTIVAMDTSHQYASAAPYVVTLGYGFMGWYNYVAPQITQQNIDICTDIAENDQQEILIYPNPANKFLFIETLYNAEIEIYNSEGRLIIRKRIEGTSTKIDLSSLSEGLYLVKINHEQGIISRKILIEH